MLRSKHLEDRSALSVDLAVVSDIDRQLGSLAISSSSLDLTPLFTSQTLVFKIYAFDSKHVADGLGASSTIEVNNLGHDI